MYQTDYLGTDTAYSFGADTGFASLPVTYGAHIGQDVEEVEDATGTVISSIGEFLVNIDGGEGRPNGMRNSMLAGAVGAAMNVFGDDGSVVGAFADYLIYMGLYNIGMNFAGQMATSTIDIGALFRESGGSIGGTVVGFILKSEAIEERLGDVLPDWEVPVLEIPLTSGGGGMFNLMQRFDY